MRTTDAMSELRAQPISLPNRNARETADSKLLLSIVVPAFNEAAILERNLTTLCRYMDNWLGSERRWELILVNDGSRDETGELAESFSKSRDNIRVLHHPRNFGLGQSLKYAFNNCRGEYIVTLDCDLSYSPSHIRELLNKIKETRAKIVLASPYMKGGKISNVPWLRKASSVWANRFLSATATGGLSTLTGMVRAYDARFLKGLSLKSMGMEINVEIIYKAILLKARIEQIPAHLNWEFAETDGVSRRSSMKMLQHSLSVLLSGFLFRPFIFFLIPGLVLLIASFFANAWVLIHTVEQYRNAFQYPTFALKLSAAVAAAFHLAPHTFIVGGMTLILAIQLISLGILSLQSKNYFEEIFYLGTTINKGALEKERRSS